MINIATDAFTGTRFELWWWCSLRVVVDFLGRDAVSVSWSGNAMVDASDLRRQQSPFSAAQPSTTTTKQIDTFIHAGHYHKSPKGEQGSLNIAARISCYGTMQQVLCFVSSMMCNTDAQVSRSASFIFCASPRAE